MRSGGGDGTTRRQPRPESSTNCQPCSREGRHLAVIAFVCGTDHDPQSLTRQRAQLEAAGAIVLPDSASAARFAARLAQAR
jgi:hypothetical protein